METRLQNDVRRRRKLRGLNQADLARQTGIARQSIIAIEKGRLNPSIAVVLRLAAALETKVEELFVLAPPQAVDTGCTTGGARATAFQIGAEPADDGNVDAPAVPEDEDDASPGAVWDFV